MKQNKTRKTTNQTMMLMIFNDRFGFTDAVIRRKKIQGRQIIDITPEVAEIRIEEEDGMKIPTLAYRSGSKDTIVRPECKTGQQLAVAQSYFEIVNEMGETLWDKMHIGTPEYRSDRLMKTAGWTDKEQVSPLLMRHTLRITDVGIERLQQISYEDCMREGVLERVGKPGYFVRDYRNGGECIIGKTPKDVFAQVFKAEHMGEWGRNPYVFVYEFELIR